MPQIKILIKLKSYGNYLKFCCLYFQLSDGCYQNLALWLIISSFQLLKFVCPVYCVGGTLGTISNGNRYLDQALLFNVTALCLPVLQLKYTMHWYYEKVLGVYPESSLNPEDSVGSKFHFILCSDQNIKQVKNDGHKYAKMSL